MAGGGDIDQVPDWVRLAGLAAFDHREPSVRVADLEFDSLMTRLEPASGTRVLRFATAGERVTMQVTPQGDKVSLALSLAPPSAVSLDIRPVHGKVQEVSSDARGHATCPDVPAGPLSVLVHWPLPIGPVRTAWVQV